MTLLEQYLAERTMLRSERASISKHLKAHEKALRQQSWLARHFHDTAKADELLDECCDLYRQLQTIELRLRTIGGDIAEARGAQSKPRREYRRAPPRERSKRGKVILSPANR